MAIFVILGHPVTILVTDLTKDPFPLTNPGNLTNDLLILKFMQLA